MNRTSYDQRRAEQMNARALAIYADMGITPRVAPVKDWGNLNRTVRGEPLLPYRWPAECGTESGYRRHLRHNETPCDACKEANAQSKRSGKGSRMGRNAA